MKHQLRNDKTVVIRLLSPADNQKLFDYFLSLSPESKSRFGPHPFDKETVDSICTNPDTDTRRYIAEDDSTGTIIAYMLIRQGMIEWDEKRYAERGEFYDHHSTVTFAPSVADTWQHTGLGTLMNKVIEEELRSLGVKSIVLWGGVQATNEKAVNFYKKLGYQHLNSFWHDGRDNYDMVKLL